jgi:hypothetical protein
VMDDGLLCPKLPDVCLPGAAAGYAGVFYGAALGIGSRGTEVRRSVVPPGQHPGGEPRTGRCWVNLSHRNAAMRFSTLGRTDLRVSTLGFGASPLGEEYGALDFAAGERAVHCAIGHDINLFDVAPYYGRTLAEERLGSALQGKRGRVVLANLRAMETRPDAEVLAGVLRLLGTVQNVEWASGLPENNPPILVPG